MGLRNYHEEKGEVKKLIKAFISIIQNKSFKIDIGKSNFKIKEGQINKWRKTFLKIPMLISWQAHISDKIITLQRDL